MRHAHTFPLFESRLKAKVDIRLINDFVAALEQLSSPELVLKVCAISIVVHASSPIGPNSDQNRYDWSISPGSSEHKHSFPITFVLYRISWTMSWSHWWSRQWPTGTQANWNSYGSKCIPIFWTTGLGTRHPVAPSMVRGPHPLCRLELARRSLLRWGASIRILSPEVT